MRARPPNISDGIDLGPAIVIAVIKIVDEWEGRRGSQGETKGEGRDCEGAFHEMKDRRVASNIRLPLIQLGTRGILTGELFSRAPLYEYCAA
jgi:hypothetical protein